ncbi:GNAT family N-acetyltransferase [Streptomyces sp. NPDC055897]
MVRRDGLIPRQAIRDCWAGWRRGTAPAARSAASNRSTRSAVRTGSFFPSLLGRGRRIDQALYDRRNRSATQARIDGAIKSAQLSPRTAFYLAVTKRDDERAIGFVRLVRSGSQGGDIGCAIGADEWDRGYSTDAGRSVTPSKLLLTGAAPSISQTEPPPKQAGGSQHLSRPCHQQS